MNRRHLLTSGAALTAASLSPLRAQTAHAGTPRPFSVLANEGRPGGQWLVHGERAFSTKVSGADVGNRYAVLEIHTPPGRGPELHLHRGQNELFFLLRGSIGLQCAGERLVLHPGDSFMAPAEVPHAYVTLGAEPAQMLNLYDPAGGIEAFFAAYAPLIGAAGEPDRKQLADVYAHHGMEVVGPPLSAASFS